MNGFDFECCLSFSSFKQSADYLTALFGAATYIPLLELPVLLEPYTDFNRLTSLSARERGARQVHYSNLKGWEGATFPKGATYAFNVTDKE